MSKIIGIAGKAGSGKDTVANIIDMDYSWCCGDFTVSRFASGIYDVIDQWLQLPKSYFNRDLKELPMPLFLSGERAPQNFTKLLPIIYNFLGKGNKEFDAKLSRCVGEVYNYFWTKTTFYTNWNAVAELRNKDRFILVSPRELLQLLNKFTELVDSSFWINIAAQNIKKGSSVIFADVRTPTEAQFIKDSGGYLVYVERDSVSIPLSNHVSESYQQYLKDNADCVIVNNGTMDDLRDVVYETMDDFLDNLQSSNNKQLELELK